MKKLGFLLFFSFIALSALGVGYAGWSNSLNVTGTITPGIFAVTIGVEPDGLVSSVEYATIQEGASTSTNLIVNIDNAAAGNVFTVHYLVLNDGSIPANVTFDVPVVTANGTGATASDITVNTPPAPTLLEGATSISGELTIEVNDSTPMTGNISYSINIGINATPP